MKSLFITLALIGAQAQAYTHIKNPCAYPKLLGEIAAVTMTSGQDDDFNRMLEISSKCAVINPQFSHGFSKAFRGRVHTSAPRPLELVMQ